MGSRSHNVPYFILEIFVVAHLKDLPCVNEVYLPEIGTEVKPTHQSPEGSELLLF